MVLGITQDGAKGQAKPESGHGGGGLLVGELGVLLQQAFDALAQVNPRPES